MRIDFRRERICNEEELLKKKWTFAVHTTGTISELREQFQMNTLHLHDRDGESYIVVNNKVYNASDYRLITNI